MGAIHSLKKMGVGWGEAIFRASIVVSILVLNLGGKAEMGHHYHNHRGSGKLRYKAKSPSSPPGPYAARFAI